MTKYTSIGFRVSAERKAEIEAAAKEAGVSMSAWIKGAVEERFNGEQSRRLQAEKEEEVRRKKLTESLPGYSALLKMMES